MNRTLAGTGIYGWLPAFLADGNTLRRLQVFLLFVFCLGEVKAQQVMWAKVLPLAKRDYVSCVAKTEDFIFAGGYTYRNAILSDYYKAVLIKMDLNGDTVFVRDLGIPGDLMSMAVDFDGNLRLNVKNNFFGPQASYSYFITMHPSGIVLRTDTFPGYRPDACIMGKDSSLIIVGRKGRSGHPGEYSMYFRRITKDYVQEPHVELNPGHPDCWANRVEQLPNGHYLISGYVGSRIASYEVDSVGGNPAFHQWYQTLDFTNMNTGFVGRVGENNWFVAGDGNQTFVSIYDSSRTRVWQKYDPGILAPPQGMTDGSVVFGYSSGFAPYNYFYRFRSDSSLVWFFNMRDSLMQRGLPGGVDHFSYTYFPDESAVFAGTYYSGGTGDDPFFMRVANVGTPVTSLLKPKKGTLANETLAPWPNPTSGNLYLKQHFDKAEIHMYNLAAKEMGEYRIRFGQPIEISGYPAGVYLYRAVIDGKVYSGKVLKR